MALVMGVLNVTPDSFYDGGRWQKVDEAVRHAHRLVGEGAQIIDVGGESTRPGASPVSQEEELRRVVPVVRQLAEELAGRARISVDTRKRAVAEAALDAGATIVNDVSASLWAVAAQGGAGWVAMHMRGEPGDMIDKAVYSDVASEVTTYLVEKAEVAASAGVREIWVDPGIGFAKTTEQNLAVLANLETLVATGWPVVLGVSRKRFTGVARGPQGALVPPAERLEASLAAAVWGMACGVAVVRAHDVKATADAAALVGAR